MPLNNADLSQVAPCIASLKVGCRVQFARSHELTDCLPGYYIIHHRDLAGHQSLFGQLWKEYALSDSRYLTSDPFMLCVETITVVWSSLPSSLAILETNSSVARLGSALLRNRHLHRQTQPPPSSAANHHVRRASLRLYSLLFDESFGALFQQSLP